MRFYFNTYAVCEIELPDPRFVVGGDNETMATMILGLFASRADAWKEIGTREDRLRREHERPEIPIFMRTPYTPSLYQIVPLCGVIFDDLGDLETEICKVALLLFKGIGAEVPAA